MSTAITENISENMIVNESPVPCFYEQMCARLVIAREDWAEMGLNSSYYEEVLLACPTFEDFLERELRHDFHAATESTIRELRRAWLMAEQHNSAKILLTSFLELEADSTLKVLMCCLECPPITTQATQQKMSFDNGRCVNLRKTNQVI